ncbi:MAG: NUDIX hydrolase [Candidatus Vogelbacteria bacterium]|nr:NUDIX hydrolase [Candidatus Vogelbacteria bacterium]
MTVDDLSTTNSGQTTSREKASFINLAIVENKAGEVLMIRRVNKEKGGDGSTLEWAFPGGKQQLDQTREDSLARDVLDETGYEVKSVRQLHIRMHPQFPVMVAYHLCRLTKDEPTSAPSQTHEIEEVRWIPTSEIKHLIKTNLDPAVAQVLRIS